MSRGNVANGYAHSIGSVRSSRTPATTRCGARKPGTSDARASASCSFRCAAIDAATHAANIPETMSVVPHHSLCGSPHESTAGSTTNVAATVAATKRIVHGRVYVSAISRYGLATVHFQEDVLEV